jgi:hypothetical protein
MSTQNATHRDAKSAKNVETIKMLPIAASKEKKADLLATLEKFKPEPMTAEERISRIPHFEELSKRFRLLKEKANDLKMFTAGNDKTSAKLTFENSQGFKFEIKNANVIDKLVKEAQAELGILLSEANNEILTFEM